MGIQGMIIANPLQMVVRIVLKKSVFLQRIALRTCLLCVKTPWNLGYVFVVGKELPQVFVCLAQWSPSLCGENVRLVMRSLTIQALDIVALGITHLKKT